MQFKVLKLAVLLLFSLIFSSYAKASPAQPELSESQADLACFKPDHKTVDMFHYGKGDYEYWLFEPANPKPYTAPLIVFNHGWLSTSPVAYGAWIDHIVKRGNIVLFPVFHTGIISDPRNFTYNVIQVIKDAISKLTRNEVHVNPELNRTAFIGSSVGGIIAANLAAVADEEGIPVPGAVMCVQPGKTWQPADFLNIPLEDLSKIDPKTLLLTVVGDRDTVVKDIDAKRIFEESHNVPFSNKDYIILMSDNYGMPPLLANHYTPSASLRQYGSEIVRTGKIKSITISNPAIFDGYMDDIDAFDFYGLWKFFDGLCDAAFYGKNKKYALGNTPEQKFMGKWSDGKSVTKPIITNYP